MLEPRGEGFAALGRRAGVRSGVLSAFRAALAALKTYAGERTDGLKLSLVKTVIDECEQLDDPALTKVGALLWRFAAEAAKAEAARFAIEVGGFGPDRSAAAGPGIFARQRRFRSRAEADRGLWLDADRRRDAGACRAVGEFGRG